MDRRTPTPTPPPHPGDTDTGLPPSDVPVSLPQANLYLGLMLMCGFVLFDTQLIIEKAESGDKDYIWWVLARGGGGTGGAHGTVWEVTRDGLGPP